MASRAREIDLIDKPCFPSFTPSCAAEFLVPRRAEHRTVGAIVRDVRFATSHPDRLRFDLGRPGWRPSE